MMTNSAKTSLYILKTGMITTPEGFLSCFCNLCARISGLFHDNTRFLVAIYKVSD